MYDYGVVEKFKQVFSNTLYSPTDEAFRRCAELNEGKVYLPLISIFRPMGMEIDYSNYSMPEFFRGRKLRLMDPQIAEGQDTDNVLPEKVRNLRSLSVNLRYQMDIWGRNSNEINGLTKELIFWTVEYPHIEIQEPISGINFQFSIEFEQSVTDNTDIAGFQDRGRLYRNTLEFSLRDSRLFSYLDITGFVESIDVEVLTLENFDLLDDFSVTDDIE